MSVLDAWLRSLMKRAEQSGQSEQSALSKGLKVRVNATPPRFMVWRDEGEWGPGEASEREAHVCAKALQWTEYTLSWQGKYLICTKTEGLL